MTTGTAQMRMADRLAEGNLRQFMAEARANGESFGRIAARLFADYGIEVSGMTVSNWCDRLGIDAQDGAA